MFRNFNKSVKKIKNVRISNGNGYEVAPSKFDGIMKFSNDLRNELIEIQNNECKEQMSLVLANLT